MKKSALICNLLERRFYVTHSKELILYVWKTLPKGLFSFALYTWFIKDNFPMEKITDILMNNCRSCYHLTYVYLRFNNFQFLWPFSFSPEKGLGKTKQSLGGWLQSITLLLLRIFFSLLQQSKMVSFCVFNVRKCKHTKIKTGTYFIAQKSNITNDILIAIFTNHLLHHLSLLCPW